MTSLITLADAQRRTANRLDASGAARDDAREDHNARVKAANKAAALSTVSAAAGMAHGRHHATKTPPITPQKGAPPIPDGAVTLDAAPAAAKVERPAAQAETAAQPAGDDAGWGAGLGAAAGILGDPAF